jgi:WhiB family redox-sensing transcriptional regulator
MPTDGARAVRLPCQHLDQRWWFSDRPAELELAKSHCRQCPMQSPCLMGAIARREYCGVWGGPIFETGAIVEFKRPRGRPRKHPEGPAATVTPLRPGPVPSR